MANMQIPGNRVVQIKTFTANNGDDLDKQVNEWINKKSGDRVNTGFATIDSQITARSEFYSCTIIYSIFKV